MFENANWIKSEKDYGNTPRLFFCDLDVIMPLKKATLYISACGVYEAFVGGVKVGKNVLAPGFTSFCKHLLYQTYDITPLVAESNYLTVSVASGWYAGEIARKHFPEERNYALIAQIDLEFAGGLKKTIVTDNSWKCGTGNITYSDIYNGEHYDARIKPVTADNVIIADFDKSQLCKQDGEDIVEHDIFKPIEIITTPKGETVVDFGINLTGYPFFDGINAKEGEMVDLSFAEVLDKDGNFYNENYRDALSDFKYICRDGVQSYKPHHTFYGFRYARVNAFPQGADVMSLRAVDVFSNIKRSGDFSCGVELVNKLFENIIRGQKGNFLDVPTDCPQRNERLGWTGDAQVFCKTAAFNFNVAKFFKKWLVDLRCDQAEDGEVAHTVPHIGWGFGAAAWSEAIAIIPWTMYVMYGDTSYLRDMLPALINYVEYLRRSGDSEFLLIGKNQPYGDWLGLDDPSGKTHVGATDREYIAAVFYSYAVILLAKYLTVLGKDASEYYALYDNIIKSIRERYTSFTTQTACVLALKFGICTNENKKEIAKQLVDLIHERNDSLTTGFVGTPYLLHALSENGYADVAYSLLLKTDYPSWLYPVTKGATTIWEHWDGIRPDGSMWDKGMNSFNHYAYGSVADWMYGVVCGIKPCEEAHGVGFSKVELAPIPDKRLGHARASYETKYGRLVSEWKYENDGFVYRFEIPDGITAKITLNGKTEVVGGGVYER